MACRSQPKPRARQHDSPAYNPHRALFVWFNLNRSLLNECILKAAQIWEIITLSDTYIRMSTSSGRKGDCERCGHMLNEHAHERDSKCKKCKKLFEICQAHIHGSEGGWRLCYVPCSCGKKYYPDKARAAVALAPHEYKADHPGYRPLPPDEEYEETTGHTADDSSSPPPEGGAWSAGHDRADSGGSEDPLSWSKARYEQETGSIAELVEDLDKARIGDTLNWSSWSWSKKWGQWERVRETSPGVWDYEYQVLLGHWSDWSWSDSWKQWERTAKDPDGNWGYDHEPSIDNSKGKEKEKDSAGPSTYTTLDPEVTSAEIGTSQPEALLVDTVKKEKNKRVFYYFHNEEGNDVQTIASDWKKGSRYVEGLEYECLVYIGKKSGRVYHTWQLGKSKSLR